MKKLRELVEADEARQIPGVRAPMQIDGQIIAKLLDSIDEMEAALEFVVEESAEEGCISVARHWLEKHKERFGDE